MSTGRTTIKARARSDGVRILRIINDTQAHGEEGARADPTRAAHEAGLDVGSERYQDAMAYLIEHAALLADARMAFDDVGDEHPTVTSPTSSPGGRWCCWRDDSPAGDIHPSARKANSLKFICKILDIPA